MTASAVANVKGGLYGDAAGLSQLTQISGRAGDRFLASKALARQGTYPLRALMLALLGAGTGGTASKTLAQIDATTSELGGKRTINNVSLINRVTTSADVTEITADILTLTTRTTFGANPVANKDGNPLGTR